MADADDIREAAATAAQEGIASSTVDGTSATAMSPMEQLKVADKLGATSAASQGHFGLRIAKFVPGGTG